MKVNGWIPHSDAVKNEKYPLKQVDLDNVYNLKDPEIKKRLKLTAPKELPESFNMLDKVDVKRLHQGNLGLCFAFAGIGISEYYLKNATENPLDKDLAEMFVGYYSRYILNGFQPPEGDDGSTILATIHALREFGICIETLWPYVEDNLNVEPSQEAIDAARQIEVGKYFNIPNNRNKITSIKQALYSGTPLMFGSLVHQSINDVEKDGLEPYSPIQSKDDPVIGGHARYIIGYDDNKEIPGAPVKGAFLVMNSWGTEWGDNGTSWVSYQVWKDQETDDMGITSMNISEDSLTSSSGVEGRFQESNQKALEVAKTAKTKIRNPVGLYFINRIIQELEN